MGPQANRFAMIGIFGLLEAVARFELVTIQLNAIGWSIEKEKVFVPVGSAEPK